MAMIEAGFFSSELSPVDLAPPQDGTQTLPRAMAEGSQPSEQNADLCDRQFRPGMNQLSRIQRIERDLHCGRPVSDADLLQHREDTRFLMEVSYERFGVTQDPKDREEARGWMYRMQEAMQRLSPAWKAAREAQIQADIGAAYFIEAGDRAREAANK